MKIKIEYSYNPEYTSPYFASTEIEGKYMCECSVGSFRDAKERLLTSIKRTRNLLIPEPEEVELG